MVKNGITFNAFLRALRRNIRNDIFLYESSYHTLEFYTRKCLFRSQILSAIEIMRVRLICRDFGIDFISWDSDHDFFEVSK